MNRTILAALAPIAIAAPAQAREHPDPVTIVTTAEPKGHFISVLLTEQSPRQGTAKPLLPRGPAGDLAPAEVPGSAIAPRGPRGMPPKARMQAGGTIEVRAIHLPNKVAGADAPIDTVDAGDPAAMARRPLAPRNPHPVILRRPT